MIDFALRRRIMVDTQVRPQDVTRYPIIDAMLTVPRELFVPQARREAAYADESIDLGEGRVVLAPRTIAKMLEAAAIQPDDLVLDVGTGFGYVAALAARMGDAVVALESDPTLAAEAESALAEAGIDNVVVIEGPLAEGAAKHGPYNVILVEGAVEQVPQALLSQLRDGGRLVAIFAEGALGVARVAYRVDGRISWRYAFNAGAPVLEGFEKPRVFAL